MVWHVDEAKSKFDQVLEACLREGPQIIARNGREEAVLVQVDEWRRLQKVESAE
ncbi:MAG: hypothetical protein JWM43_2424 [Acidobacteriaceae bacterium]|nr:hypothetical protein [Acidobacteriaceae bacterium]